MPPPRPPMPPPPPMPVGFLRLGMILVLAGAGCTAIVAVARAEVVVRALFGTMALVSLVLVEALWWVRPWVARAADAWAAACVGVVLLPTLAAVVSGELELAQLTGPMIVVCFVVLLCA